MSTTTAHVQAQIDTLANNLLALGYMDATEKVVYHQGNSSYNQSSFVEIASTRSDTGAIIGTRSVPVLPDRLGCSKKELVDNLALVNYSLYAIRERFAGFVN